MIVTISLFMMTLQTANEAAVAVRPDEPLTWSLEYPLIISPNVDAYYNCLKSREVLMDDNTTFEEQHRIALASCEKVRVKSFEGASLAIAERGNPAKETPAELERVFETVGLIHVARGKDLDDQMKIGLASNPYGQRLTAEGAIMSDDPQAPLDESQWAGDLSQDSETATAAENTNEPSQ